MQANDPGRENNSGHTEDEAPASDRNAPQNESLTTSDMTTTTDEIDQRTDHPDQRHRYECAACESRGPLRDDRDQAARDAQQHDIGFHDGIITSELVAFEVATDGGEAFTLSCWDCERETRRANLQTTEVMIHDDDGLGYEWVPVPLCHDCRLKRFGYDCPECGKTWRDQLEAELCCDGPGPDGEVIATDGGQRGRRLLHEEENRTYACPECDNGGMVYRRAASDDHRGYAGDDAECRCHMCGATFEYDAVVERAYRSNGNGGGGLGPLGQRLDEMDPDDLLTDGGLDTVQACPECDTANFKVRADSMQSTPRQGDSDARYVCMDCGARFDEPVRRERRGAGGRHGTAKLLADAEPGDLLTDGGVEMHYRARGRQTLHTDRDCQYLESATAVVEADPDVWDGPTCSGCLGTVTRADSQDHSAHKRLLRLGQQSADGIVTDGGDEA